MLFPLAITIFSRRVPYTMPSPTATAMAGLTAGLLLANNVTFVSLPNTLSFVEIDVSSKSWLLPLGGLTQDLYVYWKILHIFDESAPFNEIQLMEEFLSTGYAILLRYREYEARHGPSELFEWGIEY
jgi:hypothetical protein